MGRRICWRKAICLGIPVEFQERISLFPVELRELLEAELETGNSIVGVERGFPAAPCGAYVILARVVQPARRKSEGSIAFVERNNLQCSGEFTTLDRQFFVLEPPRSASEIGNMDAIREELIAREKASDEARFRDTYY